MALYKTMYKYDGNNTDNYVSYITASDTTSDSTWAILNDDIGFLKPASKNKKEKELKEKEQVKQIPHEIAKAVFLKALLQQKRILGIREGNAVVIVGDEFKAKSILCQGDILAFNTAGLRISGTYHSSNLRGLSPQSHVLVVLFKVLTDLPDDFMIRANCIHEAMCLLPMDSVKAVIAIMEEQVDEPSLKQLTHFAGGKNIEKADTDFPGVVLMASPME